MLIATICLRLEFALSFRFEYMPLFLYNSEFQMVFAGFGVLGCLCGKIFPAKPAPAKVAKEDGDENGTEIEEGSENINDGNKKASNSFSFSSLLGLIAAICGIVSLYADSSSIHLFRTYQTFIALSLIGLIPVSRTYNVTGRFTA